MTFSVSRDGGAFEWAGNNLNSVFCQPKRLLDLDMWRMLYDIVRFNVSARRLFQKYGPMSEVSIGEYLSKEGYSTSFRDNYLVVGSILLMTSVLAIISTAYDGSYLEYPARQVHPGLSC